jgi:hypothetical protein
MVSCSSSSILKYNGLIVWLAIFFSGLKFLLNNILLIGNRCVYFCESAFLSINKRNRNRKDSSLNSAHHRRESSDACSL